MAPAKTKRASKESPDNGSGSSSDTGDGSWIYDGSVGSCTELTTDTCSRSNTAKASEEGKGNHPSHAQAGVSNGNNSSSGLPLTLAPSAIPIVSTAHPAQAATSFNHVTATPLVSTPPPPKSGVQNYAVAQQGTLSKSSASVDPAAPIVTSKTIVVGTIITEENGETSSSLFTTVIPVTSFPSVASSGSSGSSDSSGSKDIPFAPFIEGTVGAIVVVGVFVGILLFLQKRKQSSPGRTTSSIALSHFRETSANHTINIGSQQKHEARQGMVGGELNQATSPSIMNASESSRVKRVPVPSTTDISTDPFSDDATIGSFAEFTPTSVDTFEGFELAEQGESAILVHSFNMNA